LRSPKYAPVTYLATLGIPSFSQIGRFRGLKYFLHGFSWHLTQKTHCFLA